MYSTSVFLILCSTLVCTFSAPRNCDKQIASVEDGLKKVLLLSNQLKLPQTIPDYDAYCRACKDSIKLVKKASNCFNPFPKQLFTIIATTGQKVIGQLCGRKANKEATMNKIRCLNEKVVEGLNDCAFDISRQLDFIQSNVSDTGLFSHLCCSVHSMSKCMYQKVYSTCGEGKEEGAEFVQNLMDSIFADAKTFLCGKTPSLNHCIKNEDKVMKALDTARKTGPKIFFVKPLVKLADRLVAES